MQKLDYVYLISRSRRGRKSAVNAWPTSADTFLCRLLLGFCFLDVCMCIYVMMICNLSGSCSHCFYGTSPNHSWVRYLGIYWTNFAARWRMRTCGNHSNSNVHLPPCAKISPVVAVSDTYRDYISDGYSILG